MLFKAAGLQPKIGAVLADLNTCERLLTQLTTLVDCKQVYFNYVNATKGLCEGGLLGLVLMLAASFIAAILLTIMVMHGDGDGKANLIKSLVFSFRSGSIRILGYISGRGERNVLFANLQSINFPSTSTPLHSRNDYAQVEEPSYVSHQQLTQQQQQQAQNHYHAAMSRTLPRNMNNG